LLIKSLLFKIFASEQAQKKPLFRKNGHFSGQKLKSLCGATQIGDIIAHSAIRKNASAHLTGSSRRVLLENLSARPHQTIRQGSPSRSPTIGGSLCGEVNAYFPESSV
jgi:hypothetical protein